MHDTVTVVLPLFSSMTGVVSCCPDGIEANAIGFGVNCNEQTGLPLVVPVVVPLLELLELLEMPELTVVDSPLVAPTVVVPVVPVLADAVVLVASPVEVVVVELPADAVVPAELVD